ncbi:hypothetical protein DPX16_12460 [Anabarilius grahami]|uniref:Uncharacterized protein n=1 Tax=Anabarilius grahami TaxID=495550 RepID=A0A3N0XG19_ANAGA|nr:hypothetical protein DPX16_12460 [Anabarilius grahami]
MSVRRKPCRTRLIGGGSPPGPASYENRGRIMPTVDTLHYLCKQGVSDDSRIPPGDSLSINLTIFVYGWLGDKSRRRRSDDRYLAVKEDQSISRDHPSLTHTLQPAGPCAVIGHEDFCRLTFSMVSRDPSLRPLN